LFPQISEPAVLLGLEALKAGTGSYIQIPAEHWLLCSWVSRKGHLEVTRQVDVCGYG